MKTYQLYLIRHGLTQGNLDGQYIGQTDQPLCAQGREQLRQMAGQWRYPACDALFVSPLKRCIETAELLYPNQKPLVIPDLIEYDFGDFERKTADELAGNDLFAAWLQGGPDDAPPFGETNRHFQRRVCACFDSIVRGMIQTGTATAAVVTHGGVIGTILAAFGLPEAPLHDWMTPSGCGYTVRITPSLWMRGQKMEVLAELPEPVEELDARDGADFTPLWRELDEEEPDDGPDE